MKYDPTQHGRGAREHAGKEIEGHHQRWAWEEADKRNAELSGVDWFWVPTHAVYLDEKLQPRTENALDYRLVEQYADAYEHWPPVTVQKDTWYLIDGRHRYHACTGRSGGVDRYWIKVRELDIPDEELIDYAVKANVGHGRAASAADRTYWAKDFLKRHPDWADSRIADWTGASSRLVWDLRSKAVAAERRRAEDEGSLPQIAGVAPEKRLGKDDVYRAVPRVAPVNRPDHSRNLRETTITRTRDPQAEPEYEEPTRSLEPDPEDWPEEDDPTSEDAPEKFEDLAFKDHEYRPDDDMVCLDCGEGAHRPWFEDGDGEPSAIAQGEVEQRPLHAPSPDPIGRLTGLSDAALKYISALETAAQTSDEVVAEVEAHSEARREARWHRATIAEQGKVPA